MKVEALRWSLCLLALSGLSACGLSGGSDVSMVDGTNADDWPSYGRTYGEQHFSPLDQINADTVGQLGLAWSLDLPPSNTSTQPIVVDGVIYFARGYSVVNAVDAVTGKLLWEYDPKVPESVDAAGRTLIGWGSRGIAYWGGKVFTVSNEGRLIAVDTKTGKPAWEEKVIDKDDISYFTGAPRVYDGIVVVGNSGDNGVMRGHLTAFDADTGKRLWRFWAVPGDPAKGFERPELEMAAKTWSGKWWEKGGNGSPWNAITYDPETQTVFVGTSNGWPFNHRVRSDGKGDNLFVSSIVALDLKTGAYKWHYQGTPADTWDYTMTQDIELADLEIDGKMRKVLLTAPKNGFFFVIDRINGEFISAEPFVKVNWATHYDKKTGRPVETPGARYPKGKTFVAWPTIFGGHNLQPMAYSPQTKLTYIPIVDLGGTYTDNTDKTTWDPEHGQFSTGVDSTGDVEGDTRPEEATASLIAWDPVRQKVVWRVQAPKMVPAGVMATAGGLVFQGAIDGSFNAYSASDGKKLWSYNMQAPGVIAPVTYAVDGKQYVTILTGSSGVPSAWGRAVQSYQWDYRTMARRVLTFALNGKATLPPRQKAERKKLDDPDYRPNPALAKTGSDLYGMMCFACHGYAAVSGGRAPDLRYSPLSLDADAFATIVRDGPLLSAGMPRYSSLTDKQLDALRQYVRAQAHDPEYDKEVKKSDMTIAPR